MYIYKYSCMQPLPGPSAKVEDKIANMAGGVRPTATISS